jgi:hypothetical protein
VPSSERPSGQPGVLQSKLFPSSEALVYVTWRSASTSPPRARARDSPVLWWRGLSSEMALRPGRVVGRSGDGDKHKMGATPRFLASPRAYAQHVRGLLAGVVHAGSRERMSCISATPAVLFELTEDPPCSAETDHVKR